MKMTSLIIVRIYPTASTEVSIQVEKQVCITATRHCVPRSHSDIWRETQGTIDITHAISPSNSTKPPFSSIESDEVSGNCGITT